MTRCCVALPWQPLTLASGGRSRRCHIGQCFGVACAGRLLVPERLRHRHADERVGVQRLPRRSPQLQQLTQPRHDHQFHGLQVRCHSSPPRGPPSPQCCSCADGLRISYSQASSAEQHGRFVQHSLHKRCALVSVELTTFGAEGCTSFDAQRRPMLQGPDSGAGGTDAVGVGYISVASQDDRTSVGGGDRFGPRPCGHATATAAPVTTTAAAA